MIHQSLVMLLSVPGQSGALSPFVDKLKLDPAVMSCIGLFAVKAQRTFGCTFSLPADNTEVISGVVPPSWYLLHSHQNRPASAITTKYQS